MTDHNTSHQPGNPDALKWLSENNVPETPYRKDLTQDDINSLDAQIDALKNARDRLMSEIEPYLDAIDMFEKVRTGELPKEAVTKYKETN